TPLSLIAADWVTQSGRCGNWLETIRRYSANKAKRSLELCQCSFATLLPFIRIVWIGVLSTVCERMAADYVARCCDPPADFGFLHQSHLSRIGLLASPFRTKQSRGVNRREMPIQKVVGLSQLIIGRTTRRGLDFQPCNSTIESQGFFLSS